MALSALRGRSNARAGQETPLEIGSSDAAIVNCPVCSRPIVSDARRCPGCGTRLIMGVPARRASAFLSIGALVGLLVGGVVVGSAAVALQPAVASPATAASASSAPAPGSSSAPVTPAAPATAVAALRQAVAINGRLASGVEALRTSLAAQPFESFAVASVLRALAADAAVGSDAATRLRPWPEADQTRATLAALFGQVRTTARSGLAASFANEGAYRAAATDMLAVLAGVAAADDEARSLAGRVGVELSAGVAP